MPDYPAQYEVKPLGKPFDATGENAVRVPGSKSLTNRALLLAVLAEGTTTLSGVLFADDSRVMMDALQALGFRLDIDEADATVAVHGRGGAIPNRGTDVELFLGNAGTATRFLTAACCLGEPGASYVIDGVPRMCERPIGELVDLLRQLGATIDYLGHDGYPPLRVHGGLRERLDSVPYASQATVGTLQSSQYVSALLQIGACLPRGLELTFAGEVTSRPYVEMTMATLQDFGVEAAWEGRRVRVLGASTAVASPYRLEPDASNASYFLAAAAVAPGSVCEVEGLSIDSVQGDALFQERLRAMGADANDAETPPLRVSAPRPSRLRGSDLDFGDMPDMAQTLAVVALFAEGVTTIRNVGNLRIKETDRLAALETELAKLGAAVEIDGHDLRVEPPSDDASLPLPSGGVVEIDTYDDHRMAMSFAVAGLASDRLPGRPRVVINDPGCVAKTYPGFWDDLRRYLGAEIVAVERPETAEEAAR